MKMPEAKAGVVPELRFPKFRDAGPWEVKSIADLSERIAQGGTPATSVAEYWNGGIPWITPAEMGDDAATHYTSATVRTISAEGLRNSSAELLPVNSVIISSRAPIGYVTINSVEMATNQGCKGIVPCADVHHEFLYFGLLNAKTRLNDIGAGAGFKEISTSSLAAFQIPVPSLPEQQQIADCLTSLDDLIRAEEGRLGALKDHKRGLMQRLFPAPGQTTPRLRFPEFRHAGPWEVKRLGEIAEINPSTGPLPPNFVYIDLESVVGGELVQKKHISRKGAPSRAQRVLKVGDVIYQMVRPYQMNNLLFEMDDGQEYVASTGYAQLRAEGSSTFLYQLIHTTPFTNSVLEKCTGSNYPAISSSDLADLRTRVPALPEQQKIADCLTALDDLIRAQGETIAALKGHKAGLMQKLFPREVG